LIEFPNDNYNVIELMLIENMTRFKEIHFSNKYKKWGFKLNNISAKFKKWYNIYIWFVFKRIKNRSKG